MIIRATKKKNLSARDLGFENATPIFSDDHLKSEIKELLFKAKEQERDGALVFVRVRDCQIFIKETAVR